MSERQFDLIVLGAGSAGEVCAGRLAEARRIPGVPVGEAGRLDPEAVLARRDEVIHDLDDSGQLPWLRERGIELLRGAARFEGERAIRVGGELLGAGRAVVVATGSGAAMPPLEGLDAAGITPDEGGFLATDQRMRVGGREWLYAVGDVNGRALLTHMGKYQAWVASENLLGRPTEAVAAGLGSPRVTFTDPQVAAVGKTLAEAREAGLDAVLAAVPLPRLRHAVAPYPTRSEVWLKLLERYEGLG